YPAPRVAAVPMVVSEKGSREAQPAHDAADLRLLHQVPLGERARVLGAGQRSGALPLPRLPHRVVEQRRGATGSVVASSLAIPYQRDAAAVQVAEVGLIADGSATLAADIVCGSVVWGRLSPSCGCRICGVH